MSDRGHNQFYDDPAVRAAIKAAWKANRSIALADFLDDESLDAIKKRTKGKWKQTYIPDKHRYEESDLRVHGLHGFVKSITGKEPLSAPCRRFRSGDYTILHDKDVQQPGIVALLFLDDWDGAWGGKVVFMKGGETLEEFVPRRNTLLIVERKKGVRCFVKYVNHKAGKRKMTVISP